MRPLYFCLALVASAVLAACGGKITCADDGCDAPEEDPGPAAPPRPTADVTAPRDDEGRSSPPSSSPRDGTCPPPYWVRADDGRCVWSCSEGTTPSDATRECVCREGTREVGVDAFGRRVCR